MTSKKKKILHVITDLETGGAEKSLYNLLNNGLSLKYDNYVLSLNNLGSIGSNIQSLDIPVEILRMRDGKVTQLASIVKFRKLLQDIVPDIIQGWMYHGNLAAITAKKLTANKPIVSWNIRQSLYDISKEKWLTKKVIYINKKLSAFTDAIIYNSSLSKEQHEKFGFDPSCGLLIPNGFNLNTWHPDADSRERLRTELKVPIDTLIVGHVARYHPMKDHQNFIKAIDKVILKNPSTHFLIVGKNITYDNKEISSLLEHIPPSQIHLLGERNDIELLMPSMDILCLSSAWGEGFPNVLGEAMACAIPCVSTDIGDSRLVVGDTGIIVPPQNSTALANAMNTLLEKTSKQRLNLGIVARNRITNHFSLEKTLEKYIAIYSEQLEKRKLS